jgi:hypothetical protein
MRSRNHTDTETATAPYPPALVLAPPAGAPAPVELPALDPTLSSDGDLWNRVNDLSEHARELALAILPAATRDSVALRLEAMEDHLGYQHAPWLERLMIEQATTYWLLFELAQALYHSAALGESSATVLEILERRVTGAYGRYVRALDALVAMRGW